MTTNPLPEPRETAVRPVFLVVDRQAAEAARVARFLEGEGYEVLTARTGEQAFNILDRQAVDGILTETRAPEIDGIRVMQVARRLDPEACVILIADPDRSSATRALLEGAWRLATPAAYPGEGAGGAAAVAPQPGAARGGARAHRRLDQKYGVHNIIGRSPAISQVLDRILQTAPTDATVLITGETGTGKELVAAALHQNSPRRNGPSIKLHCGDLSEGLVESELFGHEKGAFTGAVRARRGASSWPTAARSSSTRWGSCRRRAGATPARPAGARVDAGRGRNVRFGSTCACRGHQSGPAGAGADGRNSARTSSIG